MSTSTPDEQPTDQQPTDVDAQALLQELATSVALLPQDGMDNAETPPDGSISIPVIEQDGTQYVPVFTSEEALRAAGADPEPAVGLPLAELAAGWPSEELWLAVNPGNEDGITLPPEAVKALASFAQGPGGAEQPAAG